MAPVPLKRLIATQTARHKEMEQMLKRLKEKPKEMLNKLILQARVDSLNKTWNEIRNTHADIVTREDSENENYVINDDFGQVQALYEDALDESLTLMNKIQGPLFNSSAYESESESRVAKLPKLDLPKFSGNYEEWESFSDLFTSLVHNAERISDATKLQYLKSCLTGPAANLVKDVATTNANYATTWDALQARFDNPRLIVNEHLTSLMNLPKLKQESATALRTFVDESQRIVRALANLKMPVDYWDVWLIHVLAEKLDQKSRRAWETELSSKFPLNRESDELYVVPKFSDFADFLEKRARTLTILKITPTIEKNNTMNFKQRNTIKTLHTQQINSKSNLICKYCNSSHFLYKCPDFLKKPINERKHEVRRLKLCFNCLSDSHLVANCYSNGRCRNCQAKHHTVLHEAQSTQARVHAASTGPDVKSISQKSESKVNALSTQVEIPRGAVLFATAKVSLLGPFNNKTIIRVLLDQASEVSFVSQAAVQLLKLPTKPTQIEISGVNESITGTARLCTRLQLRSITDPNFEFETVALVMPRLTSQLPRRNVTEIDLKDFKELVLADPQFYLSDRVDVILGADVYGRLLKPGLKTIASSDLVAQNTSLGWIISGPIKSNVPRRAEKNIDPVNVLHCVSNEQLNDSLQQFWNLEDFSDVNLRLKPDDEFCETQFEKTHTRDESGRYVVRLPVKKELPHVGQETRQIALKSLAYTHKKFERDIKLSEAYCDFMSAYESLGHMSRVPVSEVNRERVWYLPHHAVITNKIRVVFNAARKTKDQHCLNNFLLPGPPLQRDLSMILLGWRQHKFVFTADVVKMFRQIRVADEDQDIQRIVWSPSAKEPPVDYRLTTVTYGTACAPYLAIRTLLQIAKDNRFLFPLGAKCIEENIYVDDTFAGADQLCKAVEIRKQLVEILKLAGVELDKWAANHRELLPENIREQKAKETKHLIASEEVKTLGIWWDPVRDIFKFSSKNLEEMLNASTKRKLLSHIASLFDPLGWLSPVTIIGKILVQDLWILKSDWDEVLPACIREKWQKYCLSLKFLSEISINRWLGITPDNNCQLHGFADASSRAYGAVVYLRYSLKNGKYVTVLLTSKTKVAPVKTVSIPNLELCGAVLLVKLIKKLQQVDFLKNIPIYAWLDSQIVIMWLQKHPRSWKTFVANRVSFIQTELPSALWAHVGTKWT